MEPLIRYRALERILIEVGAIVCVVLGALLYRTSMGGTSQVNAEGKGFKISLTNATPGSVLALFGMTVMVFGLIRPLKASQQEGDNGRDSSNVLPSRAGSQAGDNHGIEKTTSVVYDRNDTLLNQLLGEVQDLEPSQGAPVEVLRAFAARAKGFRCPSLTGLGGQCFCSEMASAQTTDPDEARRSLADFRRRAKILLASNGQ
jgi:hypothetical protein